MGSNYASLATWWVQSIRELQNAHHRQAGFLQQQFPLEKVEQLKITPGWRELAPVWLESSLLPWADRELQTRKALEQQLSAKLLDGRRRKGAFMPEVKGLDLQIMSNQNRSKQHKRKTESRPRGQISRTWPCIPLLLFVPAACRS